MGDSPQTIPVASGNATGALQTAGQTVLIPETQPQSLIPVFDKDGKKIVVIVNGVRAVIQGYDKATGKLHLTCDDTESNRAKFKKSTQPTTDRTNEPSTDASVRFFRDSQGNPLTITVKNPDLAKKISGSQMILTQKEAENAIKKSKRTLMHIVDKTEQAEATQEKQAVKTEKEGWWSKHWWKVLIGILIAATIGILGFRKGGWWNKRKKSKSSSTNPTSTSGGLVLDKTEYHGTDTPPNTAGATTGMTQAPTLDTPDATTGMTQAPSLDTSAFISISGTVLGGSANSGALFDNQNSR